MLTFCAYFFAGCTAIIVFGKILTVFDKTNKEVLVHWRKQVEFMEKRNLWEQEVLELMKKGGFMYYPDKDMPKTGNSL